MKVLDVVFGKRVAGSFYHIMPSFFTRYDCTDDQLFEVLDIAMGELENQVEVEDNIRSLLGRVHSDLQAVKETLPNDVTEIVKDINLALSELSYNDYEFICFARNDVAPGTDLSTSEDRAYVSNRDIVKNKLWGINCLRIGISIIFDNMDDSNLNSMVMEFFAQNKLRFGESEDEANIGLGQLLREYEALSQRGESALMDTTKFLHSLESLGYKFCLVLSGV